jgi:ligand-binding sensor domain-containing protein
MNKFAFLTMLLLLSFLMPAQELPPINTYIAKDYKAENQNWSISQSENKFIYVANNKGLLEFNGASWQLYPTPNETIMRSVKVLDDKIFTGFYMDFGYWQKNNFGELEFTSIVKQLNIQMLEDEQIWNILEIDGWVLFKSLERIYLYNLESNMLKIIDSEYNLHLLTKVNKFIYFQEGQKGIFKIENGQPKLVSDHQVLKDNIIVEIFEKEDKLFFLTHKAGFYYLDRGVLKKWKTPSDKLLNSVTVYRAKLLRNNEFALGTISDGFISLKSNGELNYQITQDSGLNNNTILSVFEDVEDTIWLGLDNGINSINSTSPFKIYNNNSNFIGTIYASIVFRDKLYLGTNQGLFYRNIDSEESFKLIENTQGQVWSLKIIDDQLFCGHTSGTFIIDQNKSRLIFNTQGTWTLKKIDNNTIIQGCYDGLYILKKKNRVWSLRNKIKGFSNSSKYIAKFGVHDFFVNHEYKGVFKLTLDTDLRKVVHLSKEKSLQKGLHSSLISFQDKILYSSKKGVYLYNKEKDIFTRDSIYSQLISEDNFISAELAFNKSNTILWSFSKETINYLIPGKLSNRPIVNSIPISASVPKATFRL